MRTTRMTDDSDMPLIVCVENVSAEQLSYLAKKRTYLPALIYHGL